MIKNEWFDQSSIYSKQHHKFYVWILYPVILLFILLFLFIFFAKKEVVIKSVGQITAETIKVQIPINSKIDKNMLYENKKVKKGDTLVTFDLTTLLDQKKSLEQNIEDIENQKKVAQQFITGISQNINPFQEDDAYGYNSQLKSILAEETANTYSVNQSIENNEAEKRKYNEAQLNLSQQIDSHQREVDELQNVRIAWLNNQSISGFSTGVQSKYEMWQNQLSDTPDEQKAQVKVTTLSTIDEELNQLNQEIEQIKMTKSNAEVPPNIDNTVQSENNKNVQLKEQTISATKQKLVELSDSQKKNYDTLKEINAQINTGTIVASKKGIIHLTSDLSGQKDIPKGTIIAEIYPKQNAGKIKFTSLISADKVADIKPGMKVHFKLNKTGVTSTTLEGTLNKISATSTNTKSGIFYTVKGQLDVVNNEIITPYGVTGELSLITGEKLIFNR